MPGAELAVASAARAREYPTRPSRPTLTLWRQCPLDIKPAIHRNEGEASQQEQRDCLTGRLQMRVLQLLLGLHGARSTRIPGAVSGRITTVAPLLCVHPAGSRNQ